MENPITNPSYYRKHPSKIECINITEHMNFCLGNAIKYIWRADYKNNDIEDLEKAIWYIKREIYLREQKKIKKDENIENDVNTTKWILSNEKYKKGEIKKWQNQK